MFKQAKIALGKLDFKALALALGTTPPSEADVQEILVGKQMNPTGPHRKHHRTCSVYRCIQVVMSFVVIMLLILKGSLEAPQAESSHLFCGSCLMTGLCQGHFCPLASERAQHTAGRAPVSVAR